MEKHTSLTVTRVHGTRPYLPDEYLRSRKLSEKVDTFSFGVVSAAGCRLGMVMCGERSCRYGDSNYRSFLNYRGELPPLHLCVNVIVCNLCENCAQM